MTFDLSVLDIGYYADNLIGMSVFPDNFFKCTITSPPYNVGKNGLYEKGKTKKYKSDKDIKLNYFDWLLERTKEMIRVSEYVFLNVQSLSNNKVDIIRLQYELKEFYKDVIIWTKQGQPAMEPGVLNSCFEYIFVFSKNRPDKRKFYGADFRGTLKNVMTFGQVSKNEWTGIHKAQFPQSLPNWIIDNFTKEGDKILDPFCGIGTTGVSAIERKRHFIGFDIDPIYVDVTNKRLMEVMKNG